MAFFETRSYIDTHAIDIITQSSVNDDYVYFEASNPNGYHMRHRLDILKTNSGAKTETMIAMINEDRFVAAKQYLMSVLPLVKAVELPGGGREIYCDNCRAMELSLGDLILLEVNEPAWSNCAGCALNDDTIPPLLGL